MLSSHSVSHAPLNHPTKTFESRQVIDVRVDHEQCPETGTLAEDPAGVTGIPPSTADKGEAQSLGPARATQQGLIDRFQKAGHLRVKMLQGRANLGSCHRIVDCDGALHPVKCVPVFDPCKLWTVLPQ